jgi:phospholipase/carboxylesterase
MLASAQQVLELAGALRNDSATPLILAGFSQGAVLSLIAGALGMPRLIGVVAMSGYVPQFMKSSLAGLQDVPVFMGHGEQDAVIPLALARASREVLAESGVEVDWHAYPMQHTIGQQELLDIEAWLKRRPGLAAAS